MIHIGLALLKIPSVQITLNLGDGRVVHRRHIPAMGQRGFLVSPYVETTGDFALLLAGIAGGNNVRSFQIETPAAWAWHKLFEVRLRRFEVEGDPGVRRLFAIQTSEAPPTFAHAKRHPNSAYSIDFVHGAPFRPNEGIIYAKDTLELEGWTVVSGKDGITASEVWIALTQADGSAISTGLSRRHDRM
jgi:hypothetical protein